MVEVSQVTEDRFLKGKALKVGIFLSLFDAHINTSPCRGEIKYLQYQPGKFLNVLRKESVNRNESHWIGIEAGGRRVLVRQIAGAIARRIYWDVRLNQGVERGQKIGIICYGSRVECYLPEDAFRLKIKMGDHVKAGETLLGEWK